MLKRAKSMREEAELATVAEVKSSYARLMAAKKVIKVYAGMVIPRARLLLSSSQEAYKSSKGDFLGVVDSIRSLNNAELMLVRAKADEAVAFADLERAVGSSPAKEGK
jgi:outer membrane protein TolC